MLTTWRAVSYFISDAIQYKIVHIYSSQKSHFALEDKKFGRCLLRNLVDVVPDDGGVE